MLALESKNEGETVVISAHLQSYLIFFIVAIRLEAHPLCIETSFLLPLIK